jgi:hypothetical protein
MRVRVDRRRRWWPGLVFALALGLGAGPRGITGPASAAPAGPTGTLARYFEALRRTDADGVRATLAPDYRYDRSDNPAFDPENPFGCPLGLIYRSLDYRIEALTTAGKTATARVTTLFQGDLKNLPLLGGPVPVFGTSSLVMELEPRGEEWKLTAVRSVRAVYHNPVVPFPPGARILFLDPPLTLSDCTVNGRTSLTAPPGAKLTLAGKTRATLYVIGVIGAFDLVSLPSLRLDQPVDQYRRPWQLPLTAPETPGRYLAYALSVVFGTDPTTGQSAFLGGEQVSVPVTVVNPQ